METKLIIDDQIEGLFREYLKRMVRYRKAYRSLLDDEYVLRGSFSIFSGSNAGLYILSGSSSKEEKFSGDALPLDLYDMQQLVGANVWPDNSFRARYCWVMIELKMRQAFDEHINTENPLSLRKWLNTSTRLLRASLVLIQKTNDGIFL